MDAVNTQMHKHMGVPITYESGFNSAARFYPCLKRLVGQMPARYRRTQLERPRTPSRPAVT